MQLFLLGENAESGYFLDGDEAHHCMRVLRHQPGDRIHAIDGAGNKFTAVIRGLNKKTVDLDIEEKTPNWGEPPYKLSLGISPLRQRDRFEWAIEKAVELGVSEIAPVICKRTVKTGLKEERILKLVVSALKQCKRSRLPNLPGLDTIKDYLPKSSGLKLIAWCEADQAIQTYREEIEKADEIAILIGPEGDFTEEEVAQATKAGFKAVSLGTTRLRTETAALYGLATIKSIKGF